MNDVKRGDILVLVGTRKGVFILRSNAYLHALRDGMATDDLDPCGVYIGTTTGQIFYSRDNGDSWELMIDYLPPINSIDTAIAV